MKPLEITCAELESLLRSGEPISLIDCREPAEHEIVSLPNGELIPMAQIPGCRDDLANRDTPLVVYCHHGMRSAQVAAWLRENGAPDAQSLAGGIDAWAVAIDPSLPRY